MSSLGIIAGNGRYPQILAESARRQGRGPIVMAAFHDETLPETVALADVVEWMRVGQLGRMTKFFQSHGVKEAIMAGQIAPGNLFALRPDLKALVMLARLRTRNAESIFGAIAEELERGAGVRLLPATTHLEHLLPAAGPVAGPGLSRQERADVEYGLEVAREVSRLDIGQTVLVRKGTVLAVEAFEGTNEAIRRGGMLGREQAVMVKVSKPRQDFRFDVPVIGPETLRVAAEAKVRVVAVEAGRTLLLDRELVVAAAERGRISLVAV